MTNKKEVRSLPSSIQHKSKAQNRSTEAEHDTVKQIKATKHKEEQNKAQQDKAQSKHNAK